MIILKPTTFQKSGFNAFIQLKLYLTKQDQYKIYTLVVQ